MPSKVKELSGQQKEFLAGILKLVKEKVWKGEDLHSQIHKLRKKLDLDPREAFAAIYIIYIGKDSGPQVGWFLASLDRKFMIKRLKEAIK